MEHTRNALKRQFAPLALMAWLILGAAAWVAEAYVLEVNADRQEEME